jgi:hypothetical protein
VITLNTPLGSYKTSGKVIDVKITNVVLDNHKEVPKANLVVKLDDTDKEVYVNTTYVFQKNGDRVQRGLWLNIDDKEKISRKSTVGHFLTLHGAKSLKDMIGKKINLYLNENNILIGECR